MDIQELKKLQEKYRNVSNDLKIAQGERNQLQLEVDNMNLKLKEAGFNNKEELYNKIKQLEIEISNLSNQIEMELNGTKN